MANLTPLPDRFFLFNIFDPPLQLEKFKSNWNRAADHVASRKGSFISTYLHHSSAADAKFPYCNFAVASSPESLAFHADAEFDKLTRQAMMGVAKGCPAGFLEIASYSGKPLVADNKKPPESSSFFVTVIKVKDEVTDKDFDANWKEWSGADLLRQKIEDEKFIESLLYKRFTNHMAPVFRYVVRTEVRNLSEASGHVIATETNDRQFPDGVETTTAFYKIASYRN